MSVLARITSWIPGIIIENLALKHRIQPHSFSATNHVMSMVYAHLARALSPNNICASLSNHSGTLKRIRVCTPPGYNGLSQVKKTRNADMAEELLWKVCELLSKAYSAFLASSRNYPRLSLRFRNQDRPRGRFHHHPIDGLLHGLDQAQAPEGGHHDVTRP